MVAIGSISGSWKPGRGILTEWTASETSLMYSSGRIIPIDVST